MRTLIRKLVLEYGTPRTGQRQPEKEGLSDRKSISPGWLKAEPCDVDLDGQGCGYEVEACRFNNAGC